MSLKRRSAFLGFVFVVCATPEVSLYTTCWVESPQNHSKQSQELCKSQPLHGCNSSIDFSCVPFKSKFRSVSLISCYRGFYLGFKKAKFTMTTEIIIIQP